MAKIRHRKRGIWPVAAAALACFFAGGLYGWSALITPLQAAFGISVADAGLAFSLAIVSFTGAALLTPGMFRQTTPTRQIAWLAGLGVASLTLATTSASYGSFLLWFSGGFGATSGAIYIAGVAIASNSQRHAVATPVVVASFGAGGAAFGPLWRVLSSLGWGLNGLLFLAAGLLVAGLIAACAKLPDAMVRTTPVSTGFARDVFQTRVALLWLTFALGSYSGLMVLGLAAKIMDAADIHVSLASAALAGIAICNTGGRLSIAWIAHTLGQQACLRLSFTATLSGLVLLLLAGTMAIPLTVGLLLIAGGYGMVASVIPVITRACFAPDEFKARFAVIFTAWGAAGFSAPWVAGALFDVTGTFDLAISTALLIAMLFGVTGSALMQVIQGDAVRY